MTTRVTNFLLRLPASIKSEAERSHAVDGTSLNRFVTTAVVEKVSALRTASYFAERRGQTDWRAFDRLMSRTGGQSPRGGDELS